MAIPSAPPSNAPSGTQSHTAPSDKSPPNNNAPQASARNLQQKSNGPAQGMQPQPMMKQSSGGGGLPFCLSKFSVASVLTVIAVVGFLFCMIDAGFNAWVTELFFTGNQKHIRRALNVMLALSKVIFFIGNAILLVALRKGERKLFFGYVGATGLSVVFKFACIITLIIGLATVNCPSRKNLASMGDKTYTLYSWQAAKKYEAMTVSDADLMAIKEGKVQPTESPKVRMTPDELFDYEEGLYCNPFYGSGSAILLFQFAFIWVELFFAFVVFKASKIDGQVPI